VVCSCWPVLLQGSSVEELLSSFGRGLNTSLAHGEDLRLDYSFNASGMEV
jgi:hypothetical protein